MGRTKPKECEKNALGVMLDIKPCCIKEGGNMTGSGLMAACMKDGKPIALNTDDYWKTDDGSSVAAIQQVNTDLQDLL
jgi:hypothetical protein